MSFVPARPLLLAGLGFVAANLLLRTLLPPFEMEGVTLKLEELARAQAGPEPYDTLFVGSSRVLHGVDPQVFDERTARGGRLTRSFNFGVEGLAAVGILTALERMGDARITGIERVFVDPEPFHKSRLDREPRARGVIAWHTPRATALRVRLILGFDGPWDERGGAILRHLRSASYRALSLGQGAPVIEGWLGTGAARRPPEELLGANGDGFAPFRTARGPGFGKQGPEGRAFYARVERMHDRKQFPEALTPAGLEIFETIRLGVEGLGAELVWVSGPTIYRQRQLQAAAARGLATPLLDFQRPDLYPELYELPQRWDSSYLNEKGARRFSLRLAEAWLALPDGAPR